MCWFGWYCQRIFDCADRGTVAETGQIRPLKVKHDHKAAAFDLLSCLSIWRTMKHAFQFLLNLFSDSSREQRIAQRKLFQSVFLLSAVELVFCDCKRYHIWNNMIIIPFIPLKLHPCLTIVTEWKCPGQNIKVL